MFRKTGAIWGVICLGSILLAGCPKDNQVVVPPPPPRPMTPPYNGPTPVQPTNNFGSTNFAPTGGQPGPVPNQAIMNPSQPTLINPNAAMQPNSMQPALRTNQQFDLTSPTPTPNNAGNPNAFGQSPGNQGFGNPNFNPGNGSPPVPPAPLSPNGNNFGLPPGPPH